MPLTWEAFLLKNVLWCRKVRYGDLAHGLFTSSCQNTRATMEILLLHLLGDYVTQSDWMAQQKTSQYFPALVHATVYTLPFLLLTHSPLALFVMWSTHFLIDRFRLARYVVWAKNFLAPRSATHDFEDDIHLSYEPELKEMWTVKPQYQWENCKITGYPNKTPPWLAFWLLIIADNAMHLGINYLSIRFL